MSSTKKDEIKDSANKFKESTEKYLEQQKQQFKDTTSNLSETTATINKNINKFQEDNTRIFEKNVDSFRKFQEQIVKTSQEISNNTIELQKNIINTYQSSYAHLLDNSYKSYWENFNIPERYSETYNTLNRNIQDGTINITNTINEIAIGGVEHFSKTVELTQRYYNDIVQNNFNYAKKIERSYNR